MKFLGAGQKNLKKLKKPEIGHYLKNNIPPKEVLFEFHVSKENVLPEGENMIETLKFKEKIKIFIKI